MMDKFFDSSVNNKIWTPILWSMNNEHVVYLHIYINYLYYGYIISMWNESQVE